MKSAEEIGAVRRQQENALIGLEKGAASRAAERPRQGCEATPRRTGGD